MGAGVGPCAVLSARASAVGVDLVDLVEPAGCVTGQQAGVAGREPRADDDGHPPLGGFGAEVEEGLDVVEPVGARHHGPALRHVLTGLRSEERRVGKECVSTCRSRWSPYPLNKTTTHHMPKHAPTK